jgi:hypothetical protein
LRAVSHLPVRSSPFHVYDTIRNSARYSNLFAP